MIQYSKNGSKQLKQTLVESEGLATLLTKMGLFGLVISILGASTRFQIQDFGSR